MGSIDYPRLYEFRFRGVDQQVKQSVWDEIAAHIYGAMGAPRRVLDPASGRGEFLNAIPAPERWAVDAVDQAEFLAPEVQSLVSDIFEADLPEGYFDGVFASNLLEHFLSQEDVARFLVRMREVMAPGGTIAILGPNFKYCAKEYFDCADHTLALTHVSVEEHLYAAGFRIKAVHPRFLPFSFRGILPPSPMLTGIYLRNPWAWRILGKQFLILAEKP